MSFVDEEDLLLRSENESGTTVQREEGEETFQRLRLFVPSGRSELVLGNNDDGHYGVRARTQAIINRDGKDFGGMSKQGVVAQTSIALGVNDRGFVGVLGMADHGNIYLCATGAADLGSSYADAQRAQIIIETAFGIVRTGLVLWGATYQSEASSSLTALINVAQMAWAGFNAVVSPMSGGKAGGFSNMDYLQTGHVGLFGARSVKMDSIEGISSSAALYNSHTAGISASISSLISASVNSGLLASVTGAYSASLNGDSASVVGAQEAKLSARVGRALIEGRTIRIGSRKFAGKWQTRLSGVQQATNDVWMRANRFIEIAVPSRRELPSTIAQNAIDGHLVGLTMHPTGMHLMPGVVRVGTDLSSLKLGKEVTILTGKSMIRAGAGSIEIGRLKIPVVTASHVALSTARAAHATALTAVEGLANQLKYIFSQGWKVTLGVAVGAAGALAAGTTGGVYGGGDAGKRAGEGGNQEKGDWVGKTVGGIIGGVTTSLAVGLIAMRIAGNVQKKAQKELQKAYEDVMLAAYNAEGKAAILDPTAPKIEVKDAEITLTVGLSQIKLTAAGVEIKATKVTVNDLDVAPGMIPVIPGVPAVAAVEAVSPAPQNDDLIEQEL